MSPKPVIGNSTHPYTPKCDCDDCADARFRSRNPHLYGADDPLGPAKGIINGVIVSMVIIVVFVAVVLLWPSLAQGRETKQPEPIAAPQSLLKAREACPNNASILECRAALRRAYAGIEWQRSENLKLARQMVGNVDAWTCIHNGKGARYGTGEGSWTDSADPYWGGLQMDRGFMRTYGMDMIRKHHGWANTWTPREQIIVAQRAYAQGRGYAPWPETSHACGLR